MKAFRAIAGIVLLVQATSLVRVLGSLRKRTKEEDVKTQPRIFWKRVWRARSDGRKLKGGLVLSPYGGFQMEVVGYYTSREMRELKFDFTPGQLKKFVGEPDEVAVGEGEFRCDLYLRNRVDAIAASPEYQQAQEGRRESTAKARETRERKAQEKAEQRAAERADFGGKVHVGTFTCIRGYLKMGVLAKDMASARSLFEKWLESPEGASFPRDCYDDILEDYKLCLKDYREEYRYDIRNYGSSNLMKPAKPLLSDYAIQLSEVTEGDANFDVEHFEIEEVTEVADEIKGYEWDIHNRQHEGL